MQPMTKDGKPGTRGPKPRGADRSEQHGTVYVGARVSLEERAAYKQQAGKMSLSDWIRSTLYNALSKARRAGLPEPKQADEHARLHDEEK